ncbi:MAG: PAS domain S-box protein, partial [Deltaproteobacteria bacterium]|nr:PAS domain S-box protein [Deltaproteobacteria bacterium]
MRQSSYDATFQDAIEELQHRLSARTISSPLAGAVIAMGINQPELKKAVMLKSREGGAVTNSLEILKPIRLRFNLDGLYLIDSSGVIIAHETSHNLSTGTDVAFRPYFQRAISGRVNVYAAIGSQSGERGLYYAAPIYADMTRSSGVVGVVSAKALGRPLDSILKRYGDASILLSPQGVVFASSREDWLCALSGSLDASRIEEIKKLKQFGNHFDTNAPKSIPFDPTSSEAFFGGEHYRQMQTPLDWGDPAGLWRIVTLWRMKRVNPPGLITSIGAVSVGLTLMISLMAFGLLENRKRHKESSRRLKFLGAAIETSSLAVILADQQGLIRWVNPQFERLTLYSLDESLGRNPEILSSGLDPKETIRDLQRRILSGKSWSGELINKRKDGSLYNVHNVITPVLDEDSQILGFVGLQADITEQKRTEQAIREERDKLRKAFAEIKTLRGLITICASCKKIRDDKGYWNRMES